MIVKHCKKCDDDTGGGTAAPSYCCHCGTQFPIEKQRQRTVAHVAPFDGKLRGGQGETKHESRIRNDRYASSRYDARVKGIDRYREDQALRKQLQEPWDE